MISFFPPLPLFLSLSFLIPVVPVIKGKNQGTISTERLMEFGTANLLIDYSCEVTRKNNLSTKSFSIIKLRSLDHFLQKSNIYTLVARIPGPFNVFFSNLSC